MVVRFPMFFFRQSYWLLKLFVKKLGYSVRIEKTCKPVLTNVFHRNYEKRALLSYIRSVFENDHSKKDLRHTNRFTSYLIGEILDELEYKVDVVDLYDEPLIDSTEYSLAIGLGRSLEEILKNRNVNVTKVIYFGTGCNPFYSNPATISRVGDFYRKTQKVLIDSSRYVKEDWPLQHELSDYLILHGSDFARSSYRLSNVCTVSAPVFIYHEVTRTVDAWTTAKKNYLWFGSSGAVHKGLDLVIDAFIQLPDSHLHICGALEAEEGFWSFYKRKIQDAPNITYHGFVDISSVAFAQILTCCAFVVFPSVSEGNSPSVITCMANGGLIPIVSESADLKMKDYVIRIGALTEEGVLDSIRTAEQLTLEQVKDYSSKVLTDTRCDHSFEKFRTDFKKKLKEALKILD